MIHHLSIGVCDTERTAKALTELFDGAYEPFALNQDSYMVHALDDYGTEIEVHPNGTKLHPNGAYGFLQGETVPREYTSAHFALSLDVPEEKVFRIAEREGWLCRHVKRRGFPCIEMWIDNQFMVEILLPEHTKVYLESCAEVRRNVAAERAAAAATAIN